MMACNCEKEGNNVSNGYGKKMRPRQNTDNYEVDIWMSGVEILQKPNRHPNINFTVEFEENHEN